MKTIILSILFAFTGVASAQDVHFSKKELVDMNAEAVCTQDFMACLELTQTACYGEVNKAARESCSKHIPKSGAGMDEINEIGKNFSNCLVSAIIGTHNQTLMKNIKTPACQSLMK
jgi:hypothetical protein